MKPSATSPFSMSPARFAAGGAPVSGRGDVPQLDEHELMRLETRSAQFGGRDPVLRPLLRQDLAQELAGFLASGFLEGEGGPVRRVISTACHPEGIDIGSVNLTLREDVLVFGFMDCQGDGDTFYVCSNGKDGVDYFAITIEGRAANGAFDIFVSEPMDWISFKEQLPQL